eukprot:6529258-Prymnesium_polylepis.1
MARPSGACPSGACECSPIGRLRVPIGHDDRSSGMTIDAAQQRCCPVGPNERCGSARVREDAVARGDDDADHDRVA